TSLEKRTFVFSLFFWRSKYGSCAPENLKPFVKNLDLFFSFPLAFTCVSHLSFYFSVPPLHTLLCPFTMNSFLCSRYFFPYSKYSFVNTNKTNATKKKISLFLSL